MVGIEFGGGVGGIGFGGGWGWWRLGVVVVELSLVEVRGGESWWRLRVVVGLGFGGGEGG